MVNQGDRVTLEIVGINGKEHPFHIEGYDVSGVVKRGEVTRVTFVADKPGVFKVACEVHEPSMQADLVFSVEAVIGSAAHAPLSGRRR